MTTRISTISHFVAVAAAAVTLATLTTAAGAPDSQPAASAPPPEAGRGVITRLVRAAGPGQVIDIPPGVYRGERILFHASGSAQAPIVLRAAEPGTVIVRGSTVLDRWRRVELNDPGAADPGAVTYVHARWPHYFEPHEPGEPRAVGLPRNQVFVDGRPWREVVRRADLAPGCFYVDADERAIYLRMPADADPADHLIEAADTAGPLLTTGGHSHLRIEGLTFEHGANRPQDAALVQIAGGEHCVLLDCTVRYAAGAGVSVRGQDHRVDRCHLNHNGQLGLHSPRARRCTVVDTELAYNNTHPGKTFNVDWEAGGCKITRSRDFVLRRVHAHHNLGSGIWFDLDNQRAAIIDCESHDNARGIHYEISYTARITGNHCYNNQMQGQPINSPTGQGIYLSSSAGCIVSGNVTHHNATRGIEVAGPVRDDGEGRQIASHSNRLIDNLVYENQQASPGFDLILGYGADPANQKPPVLIDSLLPVRPNTADRNHYFRGDGGAFFWLPAGEPAETLERWRRISGQDAHSTWAPPPPPAAAPSSNP